MGLLDITESKKITREFLESLKDWVLAGTDNNFFYKREKLYAKIGEKGVIRKFGTLIYRYVFDIHELNIYFLNYPNYDISRETYKNLLDELNPYLKKYNIDDELEFNCIVDGLAPILKNAGILVGRTENNYIDIAGWDKCLVG